MWFMQAHGALQRGISVLMIDGPGQGGTLRRHRITTRPDYEVPVGRCIDFLETREDVDASRIAVCGSSLGGYYAARGQRAMRKVFEYGKAKGVDVTLRLVSAEETGAEHCQHDNPTMGQELLADWLADRFGIDQRVLAQLSMNPLI